MNINFRIVKIIMIIIFPSLSFLGLGQNSELSDTVKKTIDEIVSYNAVLGSIHFASLNPNSSTLEWYYTLYEEAKTEVLVDLTNHNNGSVRCYAFAILVHKNYSGVLKILENHLDDNEEVFINRECTCTPYIPKIGDYYLRLVGYSPLNNSKLTKKQTNRIDSLLLHTQGSNLRSKTILLDRLEVNKQHYSIFRNSAINENHKNAIYKLAQYGKKEDIKIIDAWLKSDNPDSVKIGIWSADNYPSDTFFNTLVEIHENEMLKKNGIYYYSEYTLSLMYLLLVRHNNKKSEEVILNVIETKDELDLMKEHFASIWFALEIYPHHKNEEIKKLIKRRLSKFYLRKKAKEYKEWHNGDENNKYYSNFKIKNIYKK